MMVGNRGWRKARKRELARGKALRGRRSKEGREARNEGKSCQGEGREEENCIPSREDKHSSDSVKSLYPFLC